MIRPRPNQIGCRWTRDRLRRTTEERGGLAARRPAERRLIDAHLQRCDACRDYLGSLRGALEALELAAAESPVDPRSPSLWPALEARIAAEAHRSEAIESRPWSWFGWSSRALSPGLAAAAGLVILLTAHPRLQAWRADSESRIASAEAPLPAPVERGRPLPTLPSTARLDFLEVIEPDDLDEPSRSDVGVEGLARNTAPPSPNPVDRAIESAAAEDAGVAPRYDFDLERGVPMPRGAHVGASY